MDKLDQVLKNMEGPMIQTLREWLKIPSLLGPALPGAPFGAELRRMLTKALEDCRALGLPTEDFDGYIGHATLGEGSDEEALAILGHLDVVPVGDGWTKDPFGAELSDGRVYARGASDDKGPVVAALYAMAAVKEAGIPLKRKVRLILGCDEESGMSDIEHYKRVATMPREGFSPDATYPVINIEKGMVALELSAPLSDEGLKVLEFSVGERRNVVPGSATAKVAGGPELVDKAAEISKRHGWPLSAAHQDGVVTLTATGINGHAAYPELARNAIGQMLIALKELGAKGPIPLLADALGIDYTGKGLGVAMRDELSGPLTCNVGIARLIEGRLTLTLDLRCPLLCDLPRIKRLAQHSLPGIEVKDIGGHPPHYVPESSPLVKALLTAYHEVSGLEPYTIAIGGGTYARTMREGVAFGAQFPGDPDVAHQADEYAAVDSLIRSMRIFAHAIVKLAGA